MDAHMRFRVLLLVYDIRVLWISPRLLITEFNEMLLSTILEIKAWALARPIAERDVTEDALANGINDVQKSYEEQGRFSFLGMPGFTFKTLNPLHELHKPLHAVLIYLVKLIYFVITEQARLHLLKFISDIQFALAGLRAAVKL
jgi:hypothetical protein